MMFGNVVYAPSSEERTCPQGREVLAFGWSPMAHCQGSPRGDPPLGVCCHYLLNRSLLSCVENVLPILLRRPGAWVPLTHSPSMLKRKPSLHSKSVPGQPSSQSSQVFLTTSPVSSTWLKMIKDKISSRVHFKGLQQCCLKCRRQISPQLRTKQRHFLIQHWCTCCRSRPVKDDFHSQTANPTW